MIFFKMSFNYFFLLLFCAALQATAQSNTGISRSQSASIGSQHVVAASFCLNEVQI